MPQAVLLAAIPAAIEGASAVFGHRSQSGAQKRATAAQERAAAKAEAFERERDAQERADHARIEAEERRRWDIEQKNIAAQQAQADQRLNMGDARQAYEDKIRYGKMLRLAQLTGGPRPEPMPNFMAASGTYAPQTQMTPAPGAPIMSRPSTANAMIAPPGAFDPFASVATQGVPLSALSRRRTA